MLAFVASAVSHETEPDVVREGRGRRDRKTGDDGEDRGEGDRRYERRQQGALEPRGQQRRREVTVGRRYDVALLRQLFVELVLLRGMMRDIRDGLTGIHARADALRADDSGGAQTHERRGQVERAD